MLGHEWPLELFSRVPAVRGAVERHEVEEAEQRLLQIRKPKRRVLQRAVLVLQASADYAGLGVGFCESQQRRQAAWTDLGVRIEHQDVAAACHLERLVVRLAEADVVAI